MSQLKIHKIIGTEPTELEPDALYLLRTGRGFSLKATDMLGEILHSLNSNIEVYDSQGFVGDKLRVWSDVVQSVDGAWTCDYTNAGFTKIITVIPTPRIPNTAIANDNYFSAVLNDSITLTGCAGVASSAVLSELETNMVNTPANVPVHVLVLGMA